MASASPRSSPAPADTDLPTNENAVDANAVTEEPVMSIEVNLHKNMSSTLEQIRDEIMPNNTSEEHVVSIKRSLAGNKLDTLEQTSENRIKPKNANKNPAVSIEGSLAKKISDTLDQIFNVLGESTIAGEHGKDDRSKLWAQYRKFSNEYDDHQAHGDVTVILAYAGLLLTVIAAFVIGMQPNSADTINAHLIQLIEITVNGSSVVHDISNLSSSTKDSSSTVWIQTLAYISPALIIMAVFGAVLAKRCFGKSYEAARKQGGSLEESGMPRQMKPDGLVRFQLPPSFQAFLALLQFALLLFSILLYLNTWTDHVPTIGFMVISAASVALSYAGTVFASVWWPDSPFQTPGTDIVRASCNKFLPRRSPWLHSVSTKLSVMRWILETSTNTPIVEDAAAMIPFVQWSPNVDASVAFANLRDNFLACRDREELYVKYGKAMAHLCIQSVKIDKELLVSFWDYKFSETRSRFIRDAFMAGRAAYDQLKNTEEEDARQKHRASARTALRTILVHGLSFRLSRPDDEELIWRGDLQWRHSDEREPSFEEYDWLVNYLESNANTDDDTEGDALLALSSMRGLGSSTKRQSYISSLIRCMAFTRPPRIRHSALRTVFEAREELASITGASMPQGVDAQLLNELSCALLTAVCPNGDQTIHATGPDTSFHLDRDSCYVHLMFALTKNHEWCQRLTHDGHLGRCISLVDRVCHDRYSKLGLYLLVTFGRMKFSGKDLPFRAAEERWQLFITIAWDCVQSFFQECGVVDAIPVTVTATRLNLTASDEGVPRERFADLAAKVLRVSLSLQERQAILVDGGIAQAAIDAALSSMQGLYEDLHRMVKQRNTSQRDDGAST